MFFSGVIIITSLVIINEGAILYVSMQGTLIDSRPRRHMPKLLYIQLALYVPELVWAILGTYWTAAHVSLMCEVSLIIAVAVSVALQWSMLVIILIGTLILFDSMGKTHADHCQESSKEVGEVIKIWKITFDTATRLKLVKAWLALTCVNHHRNGSVSILHSRTLANAKRVH